MGGRFAGRLIANGFALSVYDTSANAIEACVADGARAATSARDLANRSRVVLVSLPSPEAVYDVCCGDKGLLYGSAIRTCVDLSTTGATMAEQIADELSKRDVRYVDAPVSGGPAGAQGGTLTIMAAGEPDALADANRALEAIGSRIFIVGTRPGQGQLVKLINQLLSAAAIAITGEALTLGVKAGLDPQTVIDVIAVSSGANKAALDKFPNQVLTRTFNHGFRLDLMSKDVRLCLAEATRRDVPMLLGGAVDQLWRLAEAELEPGADCTAIVQLFERWADTMIHRTPPDSS
jgi:2-hydroxy-3-oxopropionate reductase